LGYCLQYWDFSKSKWWSQHCKERFKQATARCLACLCPCKNATLKLHLAIFASSLEWFDVSWNALSFLQEIFLSFLQEIFLFVQTAWNKLGGNASLFCCHPKLCNAILILVKTGQQEGSLLLSSDDCLEICDSTIQCAQSQVSKKNTSKERDLPLLCELCNKEFKAKTEQNRSKDKSAMLEKTVQQDPKSKARFDQLLSGSKEV
jgi:hypothetical protein